MNTKSLTPTNLMKRVRGELALDRRANSDVGRDDRPRDARADADPDERFFPHDGRNLNPDLADLAGEAAALKPQPNPDAQLTPTVAETAMLKAPRWGWEVPAYLALGGIGGASATLGMVVRAVNGRDAEPFQNTALVVSGVSTGIGAGLLVADLGRPERFFNMLRVFRPSSPMNMGSWILAGQAGSTWLAILAPLVPGKRLGWLRRGGRLVGSVGSGTLGLPLAGYTGVLLGSTANPGWHEVRRELPGLFAASATSAGSAALTLTPTLGRFARSAELFGIGGRAADLLMTANVERRVRLHPPVSMAWEGGRAGQLDKVARAGTAASLLLGIIGLRFGPIRKLAAVIAVVASFVQRFAVFEAGVAAAKIPVSDLPVSFDD